MPRAQLEAASAERDGWAAFGALLRRYRLARGYSIRELARLAHLDNTYLSRLERGLMHPPQVPTVHQLAEGLDLAPPDEIALIEASGRLPASMSVVLRDRVRTTPNDVSASVTPSGGSHPSPALEPALGTPVGRYSLVVNWLRDAYGARAIMRSDVPVIDINQEDTVPLSVMLPDEESGNTVMVSATVISGLEVTPSLMRYLLEENMRLTTGAVAVNEAGDICIVDAICGASLTASGLKATTDRVVATAARLRDPIASRWSAKPDQ